MKIWEFKDENFGPLLSYVKDPNVTDINYNGRVVWIDDLEVGRYPVRDLILDTAFVNQFATRLANSVNAQFNYVENILEAETKTLRISVIHESVTNTGITISIRKTEPSRRLSKELMKSTKYCTKEMMMFLENAVKARLNILMCGLPGCGKTELLKYLTQYIPDSDRVFTLEDNLEIHYSDINPDKDCVELKINEKYFDYTRAIKGCLRQNLSWLILSEARSIEVTYLLEALSTGNHALTTLHTDDVRKVPDRIQNMMESAFDASRKENDIYNFMNIGVLLKKKINDKGMIQRYIDQICIFDRKELEDKNSITMVAESRRIVNKTLPDNIMFKFREANIKDPFYVGRGYEEWK